ncbi:histidine kinase [Thermanaerovibrio velox DSM 12556]|uniref:histidine kinase n=1 Tax=Thermanaerovibrio velox DSM 12556 TaxID=926567 RepID=H0URF2_9BACT|nr:HAMP domain-containing sensor histidine kinase [Thermanaerovibrio velox]EHM10921.1 histidine kinase [Thermanaerovibrio velox DSM 12556]
MSNQSFLELVLDRQGNVKRVIWDPEGIIRDSNFLSSMGMDPKVWLEAAEECYSRHKAVQRTFLRGRNLPSLRFRFRPTAKGEIIATGTMIPSRNRETPGIPLEGAVMGWAHDLNNLFTIMTQAIDLMENKALSGKDIDGEIKRIRRGALKARNITEWIVRLLKGSSLFESIPFAATLVLEEMADMLAASMRGVCLKLKVAPECHRAILFGVPEDLGRVVFNLSINASQAIRDSKARYGTVSITCSTSYSRRGKVLRLEIADDGPGMEAHQIKRILYDGSPNPRGHGIGISVVKDLVRQLGGSIDATSSIGQGTRFFLDLPVMKEIGHQEPLERKGSERIGLMIPKKHAKLYGSFLSAWGYRVFEIPSRDHLEHYWDELDLLIAWHEDMGTPMDTAGRLITFGDEGSGADFIVPVTRNDLGLMLQCLDQPRIIPEGSAPMGDR